MPQETNKPEKLRRIFLVLFIAFSVITLLLWWSEPVMGNIFARISLALGGSSDLPETSEKIGNTALIGSVITSVTSLIGFITTTMITWRKEKRDASLADVQRKKLETELEKSRLELEELKKSKAKKRKK